MREKPTHTQKAGKLKKLKKLINVCQSIYKKNTLYSKTLWIDYFMNKNIKLLQK